MKQGMGMGMGMVPIQEPRQEIDVVEIQSFSAGAEALAEILLKKYGDSLFAVENEMADLKIKGHFKEEVIWVARRIIWSRQNEKNK